MTKGTQDLSGRVAVVTGGAGDLGRAIAATLAANGAHVIVADIDEAGARAVAAGLETDGRRTGHVAMDVADEASVEGAFAEIARDHDRLDILVNNAGVAARKASVDLPLADWNRVLSVNLTGTFLCSRAAARRMAGSGTGAIVNIASIMGLGGNQLYANPAYHASKGGIVNLTRAQAVEWAGDGIRVNAVAPTFVDTNLTGRLLATPGLREGIIARTPMRGLAETGHVASAVLFLVSDAAAFITGTVVPVDGGWTAC